MSRLRWLILIFGPLPIIGLSWGASAWFRPEPPVPAAHNDALAEVALDATDVPSNVATAEPTARRADAEASDELQRSCRRAAERWQQLAGPGFETLVRAPFVVGGDLDAHQLESLYDDTIAPAARAMHCRYFRAQPDEPVSVLLFRDEASYNHYARELFDESGVSVFGYYKPGARTLLANLGTGTGTLVHELTHALLDFDLPGAPAWLNEGLASLHEQCRFRTDERGPWIEGLVNWRLDGLQATVGRGELRPLAALIGHDDFRGALVGTNYAQARYFFLYMQRQGLLETFIRDYRQHRHVDQSGLASAKRVFGAERWRTLDRDFERFVLGLSR